MPYTSTYVMTRPLTHLDVEHSATNAGREHNNVVRLEEAQAGTAFSNGGRAPLSNARGVTANDIERSVPNNSVNVGSNNNNDGNATRTPLVADEDVPAMTRRPRANARWVSKKLTTEVLDMVCACDTKRVLTQCSQQLSTCNM